MASDPVGFGRRDPRLRFLISVSVCVVAVFLASGAADAMKGGAGERAAGPGVDGWRHQQIDPNKVRLGDLLATRLELRQFSGDFERWGHEYAAPTPETVTFRWSTSLQDVGDALWQVATHPNPTADYVVASGFVGRVPEPGQLGVFDIDFRRTSEGGDLPVSHEPPIAYWVRVVPRRWHTPAPIRFERLTPSPPVQVRITGSGDPQQFDLPRLTASFEKITVVADGDDLSSGDLGFAFWAEYGGQRSQFAYHYASADSGDELQSDATVTVEVPPQHVALHAYAFDNDDESITVVFPIIIHTTYLCGLVPDPDAEPACPADQADGSTMIVTGTDQANVAPRTPFTIIANGDKLRFRVDGHWEVG